MTKPEVDICVLCYNAVHMTAQFLPHLAANTQGVPYKLWILDNGSTDETERCLTWFKANTKWWVPWARYRRLKAQIYISPVNAGFAAGNNKLAANGSAPWILFLNNDAFPHDPNWLADMIRTADAEGWDAVGPISDRVLGIQDKKWGKEFPARHETKFLSGFCLLIRREVFHALNAWDEAFFNGDEDIDLSIRLRKGAHKIGVDRNVFVQHACSESMRPWCAKQGKTVEQHYMSTRHLLLRKHGEGWHRDLFYWENLRTPKETWDAQGVLPNGYWRGHVGSGDSAIRQTSKLYPRHTGAGMDRIQDAGHRTQHENGPWRGTDSGTAQPGSGTEKDARATGSEGIERTDGGRIGFVEFDSGAPGIAAYPHQRPVETGVGGGGRGTRGGAYGEEGRTGEVALGHRFHFAAADALSWGGGWASGPCPFKGSGYLCLCEADEALAAV